MARNKVTYDVTGKSASKETHKEQPVNGTITVDACATPSEVRRAVADQLHGQDQAVIDLNVTRRR